MLTPFLASADDCHTFRQLVPEIRFNLVLGMSRSDVERIMKSEGFTFGKDSSARAAVRAFRPTNRDIFDYQMNVGAREGAFELWGTPDVVLQFRNDELALIKEVMITEKAADTYLTKKDSKERLWSDIITVSSAEAAQLHADLSAFWTWRFSSEPMRGGISPSARRALFGPERQILATTHWEDKNLGAYVGTIEGFEHPNDPDKLNVMSLYYLKRALPELAPVGTAPSR